MINNTQHTDFMNSSQLGIVSSNFQMQGGGGYGVDLHEVRARNKMRVKTLISKDKLKFVENFDKDNFDVYKYCCPVCLRYFNHILVSSCCKNYICRLCIG
jgi:hypothetical protein